MDLNNYMQLCYWHNINNQENKKSNIIQEEINCLSRTNISLINIKELYYNKVHEKMRRSM